MSNGFRASFRESFFRGWEAGNITQTSTRSRPSFWNPFSSWRDEEDRKLRSLYASVHRAFNASKFAKDGYLTDLAAIVVNEVCEETEFRLGSQVMSPVIEATADLIHDEFFTFPELDRDDWRRLDLKQRSELGVYLRGKQAFLNDWEARLARALRVTQNLWVGVLGEFRDNIRDQKDVEDTRALSFDAPITDLMHDPPLTMTRVIHTIWDKQLRELDLFDDLAEQLEYNLCMVSGQDWGTRYQNPKPYIFPDDQKGKTSDELTEEYLRKTPLADFFSASLPLTVPEYVRFEHCHVLGGTGHGKTQLLQFLIHHDLTRAQSEKRSVVVIDSQGDLIHTISHLECFSPEIAESLADKFLLIDPNDVEHPLALNMFDAGLERIEGYAPLEREKILNATIELYEYIFGALLGAELTQKMGVVFRYLARLLIVIPDANIQTLRELMEDGKRFKPYFSKLDGSARRFFQAQFFDPTFNATKKQILTRLWGVLANPTFERMFSHPRNKVDLFDAMNSGKIILINTARELLQDECEIFGRFFIAQIMQAATQRAGVPAEQRTPTIVYIDEAHDYFDDNIEHLLNTARKYKIGLTLAHQNLNQLNNNLRASITASTSLKFAGGVSAKDARTLGEDMRCHPEFLQSMQKRRGHTEFACWIKNETPQALRITVPLGYVNTMPTIGVDEYSLLIERNRERYCATREEADAHINTTHEVQPEETAPVVEEVVEPERPPEPHPVEQATQPAPPPNQTTTDAPPKSRSRPTRPADPYLQGQGGKEHKYLQQLIKQLAQDRGYKATVERQVLEGKGSIDVSLETDNVRIACEVSITTSAEHELGNVEKCFAAGFDEVIVISPKKRHLNTLRKHIQTHLPDEQHEHVKFFLPDEFITHLDTLAAESASSQSTTLGYKVKLGFKAKSPEETKRRRELIASTMAKSIRRTEKND